MTLYIGVGGPKRVGKDTFSMGLNKELCAAKCTSVIERLADPLYFMVEQLTGISSENLQDQSKKEKIWTNDTAPFPSLVGKCIRDLLLETGEDLRRRYGEDVLARALKAREKSHKEYVIVTDVRTNPEALAMDIVFELQRAGVTYKGGKTESGFTVPV